ncbi:MAG: DUF1189 family protein [Clostridiaceae bacterium]
MIKQILISITKPKEYSIFTKKSGGNTFLYGLFIAFIASLLISIPLYFNLSTGINDAKDYIISENIEFTFNKDKLSVPKVYNIEDDDYCIYIDTINNPGIEMLDNCNEGMLIVEDAFYQKENGAITNSTQFKELAPLNLNFNEKNLLNLLSTFKWLLPVIIWFFILLGKSISIFFTSLIVALLMLIFNKYKYTYGSLYKMAIRAATVSFLVRGIFSLFNQIFNSFTLPWYVGWIITLIYAYFAVTQPMNNGDDSDSDLPDLSNNQINSI